MSSVCTFVEFSGYVQGMVTTACPSGKMVTWSPGGVGVAGRSCRSNLVIDLVVVEVVTAALIHYSSTRFRYGPNPYIPIAKHIDDGTIVCVYNVWLFKNEIFSQLHNYGKKTYRYCHIHER